jgi:hypothetical protein
MKPAYMNNTLTMGLGASLLSLALAAPVSAQSSATESYGSGSANATSGSATSDAKPSGTKAKEDKTRDKKHVANRGNTDGGLPGARNDMPVNTPAGNRAGTGGMGMTGPNTGTDSDGSIKR